MTQLAGPDNFSNEIWPITEHIRIFLQHGGAHPIKPRRVSSKISAEALFSPGNVASFRMQVSRMTLKIRLGAAQCARTPLGFDERDRFLLGHGLGPVFAICASKRGRELEPDYFAFHYGCRIHGSKVS